jgi:hypothetical protein
MTLRRTLLLALPVAALAACGRQAPIRKAAASSRAAAAWPSVRWRSAAPGPGWAGAMPDVAPGRFRGTLNLRSHQALVDIPYDAQRFQIRYAGSTNLNASPGVIHPNYNGWVQNLQAAIIRESGIR